MQTQTLLPIEPATSARSVLTPHSPIRVFLLSGRRLLREALVRVLNNHADILLVGAEEFSVAIRVESVGSACDVLLVDPVSTNALGAHTRDTPNVRFSNLRIVAIEMEAGISDVVSSILLLAPGEDRSSALLPRSSR